MRRIDAEYKEIKARDTDVKRNYTTYYWPYGLIMGPINVVAAAGSIMTRSWLYLILYLLCALPFNFFLFIHGWRAMRIRNNTLFLYDEYSKREIDLNKCLYIKHMRLQSRVA